MIWCLHGFLGHADDWAPFRSAWADGGGESVIAQSLFDRPATGLNLPAWGARFAEEVSARDPHPVVVGYSLGGRLAMHALLARPDVFRGAVIISANPGLSDDDARRARRAADEAWAVRFESEPWQTVLDAWNRQSVFATNGEHEAPVRDEQDIDRGALASALRVWSLGTQADLRGGLSTVPCPVLWLAGAADEKFVPLARECANVTPAGTATIVPDAGHRVPWDAPNTFLEATTSFMNDLWRS